MWSPALICVCLSREWCAPNEHFLHVNAPYAVTHTRAHTPVYIFRAVDEQSGEFQWSGRKKYATKCAQRAQIPPKRNSILTSRNSVMTVNFTSLSGFARRGSIKSWDASRTVSPVRGVFSTLVIKQNTWQANLPAFTVSAALRIVEKVSFVSVSGLRPNFDCAVRT